MAGEMNGTWVEFAVGDAGTPTENFTVVPGVATLPAFPAAEPSEINVSALDSEAEEYILGLGDTGTTDLTLNLRRPPSGSGYIAAQQTLEGYAGDEILRGFRIRVRKGANIVRTYTWKGFVRTFRPNAGGPNQPLTATVSLRNSGPVTRS